MSGLGLFEGGKSAKKLKESNSKKDLAKGKKGKKKKKKKNKGNGGLIDNLELDADNLLD